MASTPRYKVGDVVGNLTVTKYVGKKRISERSPREFHMYDVICTCGNTERFSQTYLHRKDMKHVCKQCSADRRKTFWTRNNPRSSKDIVSDKDVQELSAVASMKWR